MSCQLGGTNETAESLTPYRDLSLISDAILYPNVMLKKLTFKKV